MQAGGLNGRGNGELESAIQSLRRMVPQTQRLVVSLIGRLAAKEGVDIPLGHRLPIENVDAWITKLRAERKSDRTIRLYGYLARRFLKRMPEPNRADIRKYLAERIEQTSPAAAETERKALARILNVALRPIGKCARGLVRGVWHSREGRGAPFRGVWLVGIT